MCETLNYKFNFPFTFYILHKVSVYFCVMFQIFRYASKNLGMAS